MQPLTLIFGSVNASVNASFWVGRYIHRFKNNLGQRMHPPTLIFESPDAYTDRKIELDATTTQILGLVDASAD